MRTPLLQEEIINIIPFDDFQFGTIRCIMTKTKDNSIQRPEVNKYFILKEVAERLSYSIKSLNKNRFDLEKSKYLLTRDHIIKFRASYKEALGIHTDSIDPIEINPRGMIVIDIEGLSRLIMHSIKPEVRPFQEWVYRYIIPKAMETAKYLNTGGLYFDLYNKFSKTYYSYYVNLRYNIPTITLMNIDSYSEDMHNLKYFCIVEDYQFQSRIYDIAYYMVFGRTYTSLFSNDPSVYTAINNPYQYAIEMGGVVGVKNIDNTIKCVLGYLELGYTIDYLENMFIKDKRVLNDIPILAVPCGPLYQNIQRAKRNKDISNIK